MTNKPGMLSLVIGVVVLLTAIATNFDKISDRLFPPKMIVGPPPPSVDGTWTWESSHDPAALENKLRLAHVDPAKLAANCTIAGDIHIWYQANTGNGQFTFREIPWRTEEHPMTNFFHADGRVIPIGWRTRTADRFAYFEVTH
jgi:hypothetical protein